MTLQEEYDFLWESMLDYDLKRNDLRAKYDVIKQYIALSEEADRSARKLNELWCKAKTGIELSPTRKRL